MAKVLKVNPHNPEDTIVRAAARCILEGKILLYPTETFYGLGAHYCNISALEMIFKIKDRNIHKPLPLIIPDFSFVKKLSCTLPHAAVTLTKSFWPGPLTLILNISLPLSALVAGSERKVGIRISSHPVVTSLFNFLYVPITATSANRSGEPPPREIGDISQNVLDCVDLVLDAGKTEGRLPSTILDLSIHPFKILREGAISRRAIMDRLALTELSYKKV